MIKRITTDAPRELTCKATDAARHRVHLSIYETLDAPVKRLFIALEPDTYIRPPDVCRKANEL